MKKISTLIVIALFIVMNTQKTNAQVTVEDINMELRDMYKNLKRPPDSVPFLYDMSSHVIDQKFFQSLNDSDLISKELFLTIYEEMKSAAFDTSIMESSDVIEQRLRKNSTNDTINFSILNADYATFLDEAFDIDGLYYNLTDSTILDVQSRTDEPFLLKNVFVGTISKPTSYFRKVTFKIDSNFIFARKDFLGINNRDLDPNFARWKIDFGDGKGWIEINPKETKCFSVMYPDTGLYEISIAIFHCDPYPLCNTYPSRLSKTSIYILSNGLPSEPDLIYEFNNITVGLYKGCGEMKGGVYIPQKPLIIVEGIDLLNNRSIPVLYEDNVKSNSSKKLGLLSEYNYDFYIINFRDTYLDMRDNAMGIVELLDYLKSIMNTNEQFVVFAESMGGVIARYALTYMENDIYTKNINSAKPSQMHNTRLFISNDAPHQGATVPIAFQTFFRNVHDATYFKVIKKVKHYFPLVSAEKYWNDVLDSKSVQQLLAYHIDANGPHPNRVDFMNDLISLNPNSNGYPEYCKMMAFTDGLLSGQGQLDLLNQELIPGGELANLSVKLKLVFFKKIKIDLMEEHLTLKLVNKDDQLNKLLISKSKILYRKRKGCLKHLFRGLLKDYVECVFNAGEVEKDAVQLNITSNYDTEAAGIFSVLSLLSSYDGFHNHFKFPFDVNTFVDRETGIIKATALTSRYMPLGYINSKELEAKLRISSFGFAFIPVHSAIDFDYYKTLNISTDYNLLKHNLQDFLLLNTPFHVVSGFNYRGEGYPRGVSADLNNMNWSHGYFTNLPIENNVDELYLSREIGDEKIYLNNLNLGTRSADFKFKIVNLGLQNPYYEYESDKNIKAIKYVYSKKNYFQFSEPGIVGIYYENVLREGLDKSIEGFISKHKTTIKLCENSLQRRSRSANEPLIFVTPNPFNTNLNITGLQDNGIYKIQIIDLYGKLIFEKTIDNRFEHNQIEINSQDFIENSIYLLKVFSEQELLYTLKLLKSNL
jgi:Secretion system C-terminal sorting domain